MAIGAIGGDSRSACRSSGASATEVDTRRAEPGPRLSVNARPGSGQAHRIGACLDSRGDGSEADPVSPSESLALAKHREVSALKMPGAATGSRTGAKRLDRIS